MMNCGKAEGDNAGVRAREEERRRRAGGGGEGGRIYSGLERV